MAHQLMSTYKQHVQYIVSILSNMKHKQSIMTHKYSNERPTVTNTQVNKSFDFVILFQLVIVNYNVILY